MRYYIDFFYSTRRWCVVARDTRGYISVVAGFATKRKAEQHLATLTKTD